MYRFTLKIYFVFAFLFFGYARLFAEEFPTIDRVLYANDCVREHGGGLDSLYKCSCVMDYLHKIFLTQNLIIWTLLPMVSKQLANDLLYGEILKEFVME